jgi:hypothetical protein
LVKNFLITPAKAKPLYFVASFNVSSALNFDNYTIISYYSSIEPDFLNIPSRSSKLGYILKVFIRIARGIGISSLFSF